MTFHGLSGSVGREFRNPVTGNTQPI